MKPKTSAHISAHAWAQHQRALLEGLEAQLGAVMRRRHGLGIRRIEEGLSDEEAIARAAPEKRRHLSENHESELSNFKVISIRLSEDMSVRFIIGSHTTFVSNDERIDARDGISSPSEAQLEEAAECAALYAELFLSGAAIAAPFAAIDHSDEPPISARDGAAHVFDHPFAESLESFGLEERIHESRTTIAAIHGFAELLLSEAEDESGDETRDGASERLEALHIIRDRSAHLAELFSQPLSEAIGARVSKRSANERDLHSIIHRMIAHFKTSLNDKNITIDLALKDETIEVDARMIETILRNLLENGLKATPRGGTIRVSACREGEALALIVEDSGPGIPPEARSRIFDRAQRLERMDRSKPEGSQGQEGSGLGLYLVKTVVDSRGGIIEISESEALGGARFYTSLPLPLRAPGARVSS